MTNSVIGKIKSRSYSNNTISFQNNNNFGISGLRIGFTKEKNCPTYANEDKELVASVYCTSYLTKDGVPSKSYGKLQCQSIPNNISKLGYCVLGFSPVYDKFNNDLLVFMEREGFCRQ